MRKLILQTWLTTDGFAAGPDNSLDFFASPQLNRESDEDIFRSMDTIDTILLGATTYREFVGYWPGITSAEEIMADRLNAMPKLVFSASLPEAPWGKWPPAGVVRTDATAAVRELKGQAGKDLVLWGSLSLAQSLMREALIDEYQLRICPTALGAGRRLFPDGLRLELALTATKRYASGMVLLQFAPARP